MRIIMRFAGARTAASLLAAIALCVWTVPSAASTQSPAAARVHLRPSASSSPRRAQPQRVPAVGRDAPPRSSSNQLEGLGRHIPVPASAPVPDWSKPIIVGLCILVLFLALRGSVRSRVAALRVRRRSRTPQLRQ
jgi:hypothetical protein